MEGFKEFQGKDLDGAIEEACGYFNTAREKLEIEIVQDAKSGIFGIVGARKAKVRARRVQLRETVDSILGRKGGDNAAAAQGTAQGSGQGSGLPANQASGDEVPATAETRKNGGRPAPVAVSAPAASGAEAPVATAQKPAEAPAEKGRDEGRERTRQESRSPERGQDQRGQESRPPRGQQDDRRNRGRNRNRPPSLDSYESEEALDAACNGNVLDKPADKPFDRRNDRNDRNDRNGKQDRNGNKPVNRNGRNDRRDRAGRNGEGDEAVEAGNATESAARESRGRRDDSRSEGRGNGRGDTRPTNRDGARPEDRKSVV